MMLSSIPAPGHIVPDGCFAAYEDGIVSIGNRRFERRWRVLPGGLRPLSVRLDGQELLAAPENAAGVPEARWETFTAPLTCTGLPALHARLELENARYHFAVTAAAAAVTVERESETAAVTAVTDAAGLIRSRKRKSPPPLNAAKIWKPPRRICGCWNSALRTRPTGTTICSTSSNTGSVRSNRCGCGVYCGQWRVRFPGRGLLC